MKKPLIITMLAVTATLSACTVPQMALQSDFKQQAEELPVEGRKMLKPNGDFTIGTYTVTNVKRGWVQKSGTNIFGYNENEATQKYQLSLRNSQGQEWSMISGSYLGIKSWEDGKGLTIELSPNMEYYVSKITSPEGEEWRLITVDPRHYFKRKEFFGELSNGTTTFKIDPVYKFEGKGLPLSEIVGYEFRDSGSVVGAVQVINGGKVWLNPDLQSDTRTVIASAMASFLLYNKLEESFQDN
ncbi:hypothetical protein H7F15_18940 [Pontibacter sp. Tf4]|uniref:hypothetical protein n=1 Tax=Pontibacter sp. Tf4 TaxID=2761620 RepID=UPI0016284566|nr:hypothetical protein [Pontibacter sp. Tf4]MBB6613124.1 hypothetical protein [Pontibacter sp. Tf4]